MMGLILNAWSRNSCTQCRTETIHHRGKCMTCGTLLSCLVPRLVDLDPDRHLEPRDYMGKHRKKGGLGSKKNPRRGKGIHVNLARSFANR